MSNYSQALTVIGGAIGAYVTYGSPAGWQAGASFGAALGGATGAAIDISKTKLEGPRLTDARTITAEYGDCIPWINGAGRVGGQVWWIGDRREVGTTNDQGKGGSPKQTTYTYEQDMLLGLTSHEAGDVSRIWSNGKLVWTQLPDASVDSIIASEATNLWSRLTVYGGGGSQLPDPTYEAAVGAGNAPAYRGRCSVFIEGLQLGTSGQMPNLTFEVIKQGLATLFFSAPMTTSGADTISPAATLATTGAPSYSVDGGLFERSAGYYENVTFTTGTPGKLSIQEIAKRGVWSLQGTIEVVPQITAVTGDMVRFFGSYTFSRQFYFAYRNDGGPAKLYAYVVDGLTTLTLLGVAVASGNYRIVYTTTGSSATWNAKFYVDDVLLHTHTTSGVDIENIQVGFSAGDGRGVTSMTFSKVNVLASGVGTLEIGEPLQGVVEELCSRAGMPAGTYDATALSTITKPVRSLLLAQLGATRAALQPLQLAYHFDCTLTDKLYFRPRATSAVATIPLDDLAAGVDKPSGEPFALTQGSDLELPAQVAIRYRNVDNDYQTGVEVSDRLLSGQVAQQSIEVAIGMTPSEAKALADVMVTDNLAALTSGTVSLSMAYAHLQPADVVLIDGQTMRLGRKQDARGVITFEARRHDASTILSIGATDDGYLSAGTVSAPSATTLQVLDIPLLRDADNGPGHYVAANGGETWPGASVQRSVNNVDFTQSATVLERAVFGTCTSTLASYSGVGVDERNSLTVDVGTGELASSTRAAMMLDDQINVLLVGSEIIRFVTATLTATAPNRYTLTRLIRGQRGTEWAMPGHIAAERCVLLRPQGLRYVTTPQTDIGATRYIKGVTNGLTAASVAGTPYTNTGASQKPIAPVDVRAIVDSNGFISLSWRRRSRLSYSLLASTGVPSGEASIAFEVDVVDVATSSVVRTIPTSSQGVVYSTQNQRADGIASGDSLRFDVYQMSGTVGRGVAGAGYATSIYVTLPQISTVELTGTFSAGELLALRITLEGVVSDISYTTVIGDASLSGAATSFAAVINAHASFAASAVGAVITITGPNGQAFNVSPQNTIAGTITLANTQLAKTYVALTVDGKYDLSWQSASYSGADQFQLRVQSLIDGSTIDLTAGPYAGAITAELIAGEMQTRVNANATLQALGIYASGSAMDARIMFLYVPEAIFSDYIIFRISTNTGILSYQVSATTNAALAGPAQPQITTATVPAVTSGYTYVVSVTPGGTATVVAGGGDTPTTVAASIATQLDALADYAAANVGAVVTIEHQTDNVPFGTAQAVIDSSIILSNVQTTQAAQ